MGVSLPLGIESFKELRENNYYYVDKTKLICSLLDDAVKVTLITRPRRFGKTLTMSMLEDFFDISRDSKAHFEGLNIWEDMVLCEKWMNGWPVVFLSFKSVEGLTFDTAFGRLKVLIANLCKKYAFLEHSEKVHIADRKLFVDLEFQRAERENLADCLLLLTRMMSMHYGKPCILLIDEYDVPLAKANDAGYYNEMLDMIRAMLGAALKTNEYLKFAVITGCLKISKESIFTGLNNVVVNTITMERFDELIGFTETDVQKLLADTGFTDHEEEVRVWYDGYRFGNADVYCPWDVLNHVAALQVNPTTQPANYWASTSHNDVIYKLFENKTFDVNGKFETLMSGGYILETITEDLTYDSLEASEENLWSLLLMTGYLTQAKETELEKEDSVLGSRENQYKIKEKVVALRIPNEEIKVIFKKAIIDWFKKDVQTIDRTGIFHALWEGDTQSAENDISDLLFNSISYHDYKESYYHAFVAGVFVGAGYIVESNYEYGDERPDVVIKEKRRRRVMLFEVKHADKKETLEHACEKAVEQIKKKRYAEAFDGYRTIISYGIAFKGKDCMIRRCE